jgi:hypothetical protein
MISGELLLHYKSQKRGLIQRFDTPLPRLFELAAGVVPGNEIAGFLTHGTGDLRAQSFQRGCGLLTRHGVERSSDDERLSGQTPRFDARGDPTRFDELRAELVFEKVVFDEPEWDEFANLLSQDLYAHLSSRTPSSWQNLTVRERKDQFRSMQVNDPALQSINFDEYNELRFVDLAHFERVQVDWFAQPFGRENSQRSIYRGRHGSAYYFKAKNWPSSSDSTNWIFLTTERFTTEAIAALYHAKLGPSLLRLDLDNLPACTRLMCRCEEQESQGQRSELASETS